MAISSEVIYTNAHAIIRNPRACERYDLASSSFIEDKELTKTRRASETKKEEE